MLLLQAVAQQLPPINVTVRTPPGMPEWERAAIAAGIGACFAIIANIGMEFAKPWIGTRLLKNRMLRHVDQEFLENYASLLASRQMMDEYALAPDDRKKWAGEVAEMMRDGIVRKRLDYFMENYLEMAHEVREIAQVAMFYVLFKGALASFPWSMDLLTLAEKVARKYAEDRGMQPVQPSETWLGIFRLKRPPPKQKS